jgi:hypothetical protein|tara:strand:+ start:192 stop:770 length:579 start_codon:yes stop_codon:yes gene_type:complete
MARDITTAFKNAIEGSVVKPIIGVELEFSDGTLRFWNGYGNLTMTAGGSSKTFTGAGDLLGVSEIEESSTLSMSGVTLTLAGIKSSIISTALGANYTNRKGAIYLGLYDTSSNVIADVYTLFKGNMDVMNIQEGAETCLITLKLESRLITFEKASNRMYTLEDQKVDFPNDIGFEFIPDLQDKEITWGKKTN